MSCSSILNPVDSVLIAIDIQPDFLNKLSPTRNTQVLTNACWLIGVAQWMKIPLVVTAEDYDNLPMVPEVVNLLDGVPPILNKMTFGLADQPDIMDAVEQTGRKTAILIGLETDVCVLQSALGLLDRGYRVAVVIDAVGTPDPHHEVGLERMKSAGVVMVDHKGLFYEWIRTVPMMHKFHEEMPHLRAKMEHDL